MSQHLKSMPLGEEFTRYVGPQTPEERVIEDMALVVPELLDLEMSTQLRIRAEGAFRRLRDVQERAEALRNA